MINYLSTYLLLVFMVVNTTDSFAQKISVESGQQTAGFSFTVDGSEAEPVIYYQRNIEMLSTTADKVSLSVYGDGRVLVHYPVYMKKAGDYEMHLSNAELENLLKALSRNGIMDFEENEVREKVKAEKKALRAKGRFFSISDTVETNIDIKLVDYRKNASSAIQKNFYKKFKWDNIEHDARYYNNTALTKANNSVLLLKGFTEDRRLVRKGQQ